jgi:hypothetical protein
MAEEAARHQVQTGPRETRSRAAAHAARLCNALALLADARPPSRWRSSAPRRTRAAAAAQAAAASAALQQAEESAAEAIRREAADEAARLEARRAKGDALPAEPAASAPGVARIAVRLPDGRRLDRRWAAGSTLQLVVDWVEATDSDSYDVTLVSHFPRREFSRAEHGLTLEEAGLTPQALLFVRERDDDDDNDDDDGGGGDDDAAAGAAAEIAVH